MRVKNLASYILKYIMIQLIYKYASKYIYRPKPTQIATILLLAIKLVWDASLFIFSNQLKKKIHLRFVRDIYCINSVLLQELNTVKSEAILMLVVYFKQKCLELRKEDCSF